MSNIDPTAVIDSSAKIASDVSIGAYSVIGPNVEIGSGTSIASHVVIPCNTKIGTNNKIYQFASIGGDNQDLVHDDKPTYLEIGNNNTIHEFVTINRGSVKENCVTKMGDYNLLMAYTHIGHDSVIGSHTIFANGATLAGHVIVDDYATVGAYCAIHQFCNVGAHAFVTHGAMVTKDVLPYIMVSGNVPKAFGINKVGLQRHGYSKETIKQLLQAYKVIFRQNHTTAEATDKLEVITQQCAEVKQYISALQRAQRGIVR